ncbi:MAG: alpha/beta fold hydrolase [Actinomycetota bacterium]|nr:alpha/beta fold hydrolase [Actinomycetota bacterium]MDH5279364.1 alpha/beta fold hydrolase [Actinomycetota bacterium]
MADRLATYSRDGLVFEVADAGPIDGPVVVLLHGFPQDATCWDRMAPHLHHEGYRTLAPDQRGYSPGARPSGAGSYRARELVDDVLTMMDAAGVERAHVVAHDWGAVVAWALAADQPDRVITLTSLSVPHPAAFKGAAWRGQALRSWYMGLFQIRGAAERVFRPGSPLWRQFMKGLPLEAAEHYAQRMSESGALTGALSWYRALPLDLRQASVRVGRIAVPTLYVWGARDPALGRTAAETTHRFVAGDYRFEALPTAGHWLPEAHADEVMPLLLEHLRSG